eukprot:g48699.t1
MSRVCFEVIVPGSACSPTTLSDSCNSPKQSSLPSFKTFHVIEILQTKFDLNVRSSHLTYSVVWYGIVWYDQIRSHKLHQTMDILGPLGLRYRDLGELEPAFKSAGIDNLDFSNVPGSTSSRKSYKFFVKMSNSSSPCHVTWGLHQLDQLRAQMSSYRDVNPQLGYVSSNKGRATRMCKTAVLAMGQYSFDQLNARCCHNYGPGPDCK